MNVSRRVFLKDGAFAMVSLGFAPSFLARTALAAAPQRRPRQLIAIFQRGAVDGLNMIVPFGDADYYRARPSIAIARPGKDDAAIDLDGFFALNPRLRRGRVYGRSPGLAREQRYDGRDLAVTTDFRDVFGEIVVRHLGLANPSTVFPGYPVKTEKFLGLFVGEICRSSFARIGIVRRSTASTNARTIAEAERTTNGPVVEYARG